MVDLFASPTVSHSKKFYFIYHFLLLLIRGSENEGGLLLELINARTIKFHENIMLIVPGSLLNYSKNTPLSLLVCACVCVCVCVCVCGGGNLW